jgi:flagellar basal-body rod protein FlgC
MNILDTLRISASGLTAQRVRLQAISSNMANARSTRSTEEGTPYRRQMPVFQAVEANSFGSELAQQLSRVEVVDVEKSQAPFRQVFDPGHPDADEDGYVLYPNVDILHEMVDLMNTSRTYEANTNVTETTYKMANQALELGRG